MILWWARKITIPSTAVTVTTPYMEEQATISFKAELEMTLISSIRATGRIPSVMVKATIRLNSERG